MPRLGDLGACKARGTAWMWGVVLHSGIGRTGGVGRVAPGRGSLARPQPPCVTGAVRTREKSAPLPRSVPTKRSPVVKQVCSLCVLDVAVEGFESREAVTAHGASGSCVHAKWVPLGRSARRPSADMRRTFLSSKRPCHCPPYPPSTPPGPGGAAPASPLCWPRSLGFSWLESLWETHFKLAPHDGSWQV